MPRKFFYSYLCATRFSRPVSDHVALLRCQPMVLQGQRVLEQRVALAPGFWQHPSVDWLGGSLLCIGQRGWHPSFVCQSTGVVVHEDNLAQPDEHPARFYLMPSRLTGKIGQISQTDLTNPTVSPQALCHAVFEAMTYAPGSTTPATTAAEAWAARSGVCQDYAHILIALCRQAGLPARYVTGLIEGEGTTHAWVEVWQDGFWWPLAPTHDRPAGPGYVKWSHGRDAADCQVLRAVFRGAGVAESTLVRALVMEV